MRYLRESFDITDEGFSSGILLDNDYASWDEKVYNEEEEDYEHKQCLFYIDGDPVILLE